MTTAAPTLPAPTVVDRFAEVRTRTLELVSTLDWPTLRRQHIPILSPMVWDLGHIGNFEEIWLSQRLAGRPPLADGYQTMFDPVVNPRPVREGLPLPERDELLEYLARVRQATESALREVDGRDPLTAGGLVFEMVAEHEEQHQETLLQCMQVLENPSYRPPRRRALPGGRPVDAAMVTVPAGPFRMGWEGEAFAYDNERPAHLVETGAYRIGRFPVTVGEWVAFVEDGGYRSRDPWSEAGWAWLQGEHGRGIEAPRNWTRQNGSWRVRFMDRVVPLAEVADRPVVHIGYWEAEAFARWAGKRLPTEAEWEKAALWDPATATTRRWPWGDEPPTAERANLDQLGFEPAPIGAYPQGASAVGIEQAIGDVWEWTSTDFHGYPGFAAFPYDEYSKIFFGPDYKVLRGGSWATRPAVARGTFRNWDYPIRRQIFAGVRLAEDV